MSIEAMKQAVEAFEHIKKYVTDDGAMPENWDAYHEKEYFALEALRQAIAEAERESTLQEISDIGQEAHTDHPVRHWDRTCPACVAEAEKQKPVAYYWRDTKACYWIADIPLEDLANLDVSPLYTAPPKREWVGLTDEEIKGILDCGRGGLVDIKKAEQILRERNT
jgi:hypothetical protein